MQDAATMAASANKSAFFIIEIEFNKELENSVATDGAKVVENFLAGKPICCCRC